MSERNFEFFSKSEKRSVIRSSAELIEKMRFDQNELTELAQVVSHFLRLLDVNAVEFDRSCRANIEWIGDRFISELQKAVTEDSTRRIESLKNLYVTCYRIICEFEFLQPGDISGDLKIVKLFCENNIDIFSNLQRSQLTYAANAMPASILKSMMNSSEIVHFSDFAASAGRAKDLKDQWDREFADRRDELKKYQEVIENLKTSFNFVGLVSGFDRILNSKITEKTKTFVLLCLLGLAMLVPIGFHLIAVSNAATYAEYMSGRYLHFAIPALSAEVILFYFFRATLVNFRAVSAQILQINLRVSLCQFIQSYSVYARQIREKDAKALDGFESIVFSPISPSFDSLPATIEGIEQIAKIVGTLRSVK